MENSILPTVRQDDEHLPDLGMTREEGIFATDTILAQCASRNSPPKFKGVVVGDKLTISPDEKPERELIHEAKMIKTTGTSNKGFQKRLLAQLSDRQPDDSDPVEQVNTGLAVLRGANVEDPLEAMLVAQMLKAHDAAMEFLRRATIPDQFPLAADSAISRATKLMRAYTAGMEALSRHRGKGQQTVRVEHVTVNAGGQAIVGAVENPKGGRGGANEK